MEADQHQQDVERILVEIGQTFRKIDVDEVIDMMADEIEMRSILDPGLPDDLAADRKTRKEAREYFEVLTRDWEMIDYPEEKIVADGDVYVIANPSANADILAASGARLAEVGTTNRTRIGDYRAAVTDKTGMILKVHPSNYRVIGFTAVPAASDLSALARTHDIPSGASTDKIVAAEGFDHVAAAQPQNEQIGHTGWKRRVRIDERLFAFVVDQPDIARPIVSMINFEPSDPALANGIIVGLSTNAQDLSVYNSSGAVHVIIDVTGYFQ